MAAPSNIELVRWFATGNKDPSVFLADDDLINHFLSEEGDNPRMAAARALEGLASSAALEAMSQGSGVFSADTKLVAPELRKQAEALRKSEAEIPYAVEFESHTYPWENIFLDQTSDG